MSDRDHAGGSPTGTRGRSRAALWVAFVAIHVYLGAVNLFSPTHPYGDVRAVYRGWIEQALDTHVWVGIDVPWVYPIVALVPLVITELGGLGQYGYNWLGLMLVVDTAALATLTGWGRTTRNLSAGWWWCAFLVLLGPIALGRIDAFSVAMAIIGCLLVAPRPVVATVIITLATWIKVWPAAIIAALVVAVRRRLLVVVAAVATSAVVVLVALALGSGANVASFITAQTSRGLQVEAPVTTFWMWRAFAGAPASDVYYDRPLNTFQVTGAGVDLASTLTTPLMAVAAAIVLLLGVRAMRLGVSSTHLLTVLTLALIGCLVVFNKVGSPQYVCWYAVPAILALVGTPAERREFRVPIVILLVVAALTQLIYPYFYTEVLHLEAVMLGVLTARNLLLVALLGWAVAELIRLPRRIRKESILP